MVEKKAWAVKGFAALLLWFVIMAAGVLLVVFANEGAGIAMMIVDLLLLSSFTIVQPNQAVVVTFFGTYLGTIRESGIFLTVPFSNRSKVSLRVRNFNSAKLKVNDVEGNPIEIAAVIVFKVTDSAKSKFDVDNYEQFVEIQSESALRHVANRYPYDNYGNNGYSLRGNAEEVAEELTRELQERLAVAGVQVLEARLTHLAYSPEIAAAMLQRQQATAILAARQTIVEGAVGMVQLAIAKLQADGLELDDERKAAMANNLMVAIVSDRSASPVLNAGSLY